MIHAGIKDLNFDDHERILNSIYEKFLPNKTNIGNFKPLIILQIVF